MGHSAAEGWTLSSTSGCVCSGFLLFHLTCLMGADSGSQFTAASEAEAEERRDRPGTRRVEVKAFTSLPLEMSEGK